MRWRPGFAFSLFAFVVLRCPVAVPALELEEALRLARTRAVELLEPDAEQDRARAEARAILGTYDWTLFGRTLWGQDATEQVSVFAGDRRDQLAAEVGVRRIFRAGTSVQAGLKHLREFTDFPVVPSSPPIPDVSEGAAESAAASAQATRFDASQFQILNPSYQTRLELALRQPLWRNWLGRELKLQEEIARAGEIEPLYSRRLREQVVQAETEQLYWALADAEARLELARRLLDHARRFAALMTDRRALGRADQVDVAAAEAAAAAQEGVVLNLELAADDVRRRLRIRLGLPEDAAPSPPDDALDQPPLPVSLLTRGEAIERALRDRVDLALIGASRRPHLLQQRLAEEQGKPSLSLFGSGASNGLEDGAADSIGDAGHPAYTIGMELEINLGGTAARSRRESASASLAILRAREKRIERDVRRDIDLAFRAREAARLRLEQADRYISLLKRKRDAEQVKFRQARSEEIAVLRYEMEIVTAEMDRVSARRDAREAEAALRLALHAYPSGS